MNRTVKFAISIPVDDFKSLEKLRKEKGMTRSAFIRSVIRMFKESQKMQKLVKLYIEGYKKNPENLREIEALEKASIDSLPLEDWK